MRDLGPCTVEQIHQTLLGFSAQISQPFANTCRGRGHAFLATPCEQPHYETPCHHGEERARRIRPGGRGGDGDHMSWEGRRWGGQWFRRRETLRNRPMVASPDSSESELRISA